VLASSSLVDASGLYTQRVPVALSAELLHRSKGCGGLCPRTPAGGAARPQTPCK
jgi:hypothetical protein